MRKVGSRHRKTEKHICRCLQNMQINSVNLIAIVPKKYEISDGAVNTIVMFV